MSAIIQASSLEKVSQDTIAHPPRRFLLSWSFSGASGDLTKAEADPRPLQPGM